MSLTPSFYSLPDFSPFYFLPFPPKHWHSLTLSGRLFASLTPMHMLIPKFHSLLGRGEGSIIRIALWLFIWILPGPVHDPLFQEAFHPGFSSKRMCPFSKPGWNMLICHWQLLVLPGILTFLYVHVLPPHYILSRAGTTSFCISKCTDAGPFWRYCVRVPFSK